MLFLTMNDNIVQHAADFFRFRPAALHYPQRVQDIIRSRFVFLPLVSSDGYFNGS
jgi:hypothetical protein